MKCCIFIVLLVTLAPAQVLQMPNDTQSNAVAFTEVLAGSICQPMKQLVEVEQEFPDKVQWIYFPACVPLWRCSGCCMDENLECHPLRERNVTLELMRLLPMKFSHRVHLTFVEHQQCECRMRQKLDYIKSGINNSIRTRARSRPRKPKKAEVGCGKCQFPQQKIDLY